MRYPSIIHFEPTDDGIRVEYKKDIPEGEVPDYNLDIWAISYLLNKGLYRDDSMNIIYLDITDVTMALRLHFLSRAAIFKNIQFKVSQSSVVSQRLDDILNNAGRTEKYITYDKSYDFSERGTKNTPESLLEKYICDNMSILFRNEFHRNTTHIRQFPVNMFERVISKQTRVTRKLWLDILTVNTFEQLSVIELKSGKNMPLDLLTQAIDYGIICHLFKSHYGKHWFPDLGGVSQNKIAIYCIAEKFHPAITGNKDYEGIKSVIKRNDYLDIILIQIKVENNMVEGIPITLFDTREL